MTKNQRLIIDSKFIKETLKYDLSLNEFLLLVYFDNAFDAFFDVKLISNVLELTEEKILEAYSSLLTKKIIKVETIKNREGKIEEKISLDPLYQEVLIEEKKNKQKIEKEDIFSIFETEFGRTLSGTDYEIINAWIEKGFSEELIKAALKEAVYNGVYSLRYIDKILFEWHRKGFKEVSDIKKYWQNNDSEIPKFETKVLNFDWLNESE